MKQCKLIWLSGSVNGTLEHDGKSLEHGPPRWLEWKPLQRFEHESQHAASKLHTARSANVESLDAAATISIPDDAQW